MQLKDYIRGDRRGKEANRLEREAMNDPFMQEALDGFDAVAGDHVPIIERLEKKYTIPAIVHHRNRTLWYWSAAASILLLVGMSAYFFLERTSPLSFGEDSGVRHTPVIAMNQPNESEDIIPDVSIASQLMQIEEQQQDTQAPQNQLRITPASENKLEIVEADTEIVADAIADVDIDIDADVYEVVAVTDIVVADEIATLRAVESTANFFVKSEQEKPTVRGKVVDKTGEPLPGVNIIVKGTTTGTVTDVSGTGALQGATDATKLMASFIGYENQEIQP